MSDFSSTYLTVARKPARKGLFAYLDLYKQRKTLPTLTDSQLKDVGLSRAEALMEARRPLWDAPHHWLR